MKQYRSNSSSKLHNSVLWPTAVLSIGLAAPVLAQNAGQSAAVVEEIIVSARRQEESSQDIPIAISVFNQEQLDQRNISSGTDLAAYTPSLAVNQRFGPDNPAFAIRGFTQELRTTASVGFYFAEVVAPRGGGSVTAGDGGGPGAFFDLQNVLVLKGPQGTLFGRNTTGGAIMLTPQEPTNELEGYLEGSAGDYDLRRVQGVINVPLSDTVRARFGVDTQTRDGYLKNNSGIGPSELGDLDYIAARASVVWDITDTLSNYTILSYTDSENNGTASRMFACGNGGLSSLCPAQLEAQGDDFYTLQQTAKDPVSKLEQWQVINTTAWSVSDDITIKNIMSYAELDQTLRTSVFGTNFALPIPGFPNFYFTESGQKPGISTNSQTSFVEEVQVQGYAMDSSLTWQMGLYFENSRPDGLSGSQSGNQIYCAETPGADPANFLCQDSLGLFSGGPVGNVQRQLGEVEYTSKAVYGEATYDLTDDMKVTMGLRYTEDESEGNYTSFQYNGFPGTSVGAPAQNPDGSYGQCTEAQGVFPVCAGSASQESDAVTGLIGFDYFVTQDAMLYAKYSRGYRQGSISMFSPPGLKEYKPEQVDAFEVGAKTTFGGPIPGTFNISMFYNELEDQQVQLGVQSASNAFSPTTAIVNAGKSKIQGVEIETSLMLLDDLTLDLSYTFLDTELIEAGYPTLSADYIVTPAALEGQDLTFSPHNALTATLTYMLPLPANVGDVSAGVTYTYTDSQYSSSPEFLYDADNDPSTPLALRGSPYAELDSYELVNLNLNWRSIMGSSFDAALFMTNALDQEYVVYRPGTFNSIGAEFEQSGMPRMWGARLRYSF